MMKKFGALLMCLMLTFGMSLTVWADDNVSDAVVATVEEAGNVEEQNGISGHLSGKFSVVDDVAVIDNAPVIENDVVDSGDYLYPSPDIMYKGYKQNTVYNLDFILVNEGDGSSMKIELCDADGNVWVRYPDSGIILINDAAEGQAGTFVLTIEWNVGDLPVGEYYIETYVDGGLTESLPIYITDTDVPLEGIELEYETITMEVGTEEVVGAYFIPIDTTYRGEISWSSSDPSVVEVFEYDVFNTGISIVANSAGTATVSATVGGYSTSMEVTVSDPETAKVQIGEFVTRLYQVCLNRDPDEAGKADWVDRLYCGEVTGSEAAYGFIFSAEFTKKNLCNEDFVEQLYQAFMGRASDEAGKADWVGKLNAGVTREEVFNGFALSNEFSKICKKYSIELGEGTEMPAEGTVPTGPCKVCGKETVIEQDGVEAFVKRLYRICLNRTADEEGLNTWTTALKNKTKSGRDVAYGFIFSPEFIEKDTTNEEYVEYLYKAFMGRGSDPSGKEDWLKRMDKGWTRERIFDGFVESDEFTDICKNYGIVRD